MVRVAYARSVQVCICVSVARVVANTAVGIRTHAARFGFAYHKEIPRAITIQS